MWHWLKNFFLLNFYWRLNLAGSDELNKWQPCWLSANCWLWGTGDYVCFDCWPLPVIQLVFISLLWDERHCHVLQLKCWIWPSEWHTSHRSRVRFSCCYLGPACELGREGWSQQVTFHYCLFAFVYLNFIVHCIISF